MNGPITAAELRRGCEVFEQREGRDSMYRVATFLLNHYWGRHAEMADALTVLLLTWNEAFYRYGKFSHPALESCLRQHWPLIEHFRSRAITTLTAADHPRVESVFQDLLAALAITSGKKAGTRSPVSVVKTLHLLAPRFFPLWDYAIAKAYRCTYSSRPVVAYLRFCGIVRELAAALEPQVAPSSKTLLKQIDEYNYAKYSKKWV